MKQPGRTITQEGCRSLLYKPILEAMHCPMRFIGSVALICLAATSGPALGASVTASGPDAIVVSGTIDDEDARVFWSLVESDRSRTIVVFDRCLGGTASAAFTFAGIIRERRMKTIAANQCSSACAFAFLAGSTRSFVDRVGITAISLHAARTLEGKARAPEATNSKIMSDLAKSTGGRLDPKLEKLIFQSWTPASGVMFVRRNYWLWKRDEVRYCDGSQGSDADKCSRLDGFDALSQGIVTER